MNRTGCGRFQKVATNRAMNQGNQIRISEYLPRPGQRCHWPRSFDWAACHAAKTGVRGYRSSIPDGPGAVSNGYKVVPSGIRRRPTSRFRRGACSQMIRYKRLNYCIFTTFFCSKESGQDSKRSVPFRLFDEEVGFTMQTKSTPLSLARAGICWHNIWISLAATA